jgi:uncharacterized protein (DUF433 family)
MTTVLTSHIRLDEKGIAWIDDSNIKVIEVVLDKLAYGWSAEEIALQHYNSLSLSQIHAAFSYYYDHQKDMDLEIKKQEELYDAERAAAPETLGRKKLRSLGHRP